ncbi:MAG: hypothetical protein ABI613_04695 [Gemmatimonadota bacterium]
MPDGGHQELELKAVVPDIIEVRRRLHAAQATLIFEGEMQDRRFDRDGELSRADQVLRTRRMIAADGTVETILGWKGPGKISDDGYKQREELEFTIEHGADPRPLLTALGYRQVHAIDRRIEVFESHGASVRLERYPEMDILVEIEGEPGQIERAIAVTGIDRSRFLTDSLAQFVGRYERRTGSVARIAGSLTGEGIAAR